MSAALTCVTWVAWVACLGACMGQICFGVGRIFLGKGKMWVTFFLTWIKSLRVDQLFFGIGQFVQKPRKVGFSLKSDYHLPKILFLICFNDSSPKTMKNAFYFILRAFFILKIFEFLS